MIFSRRQILLILPLILLYAVTANSQEAPVPAAQNFQQWGAVTIFNGLPSDKVHAIAQTGDGVLWFGTENGLSKFDGRRVQPVNLVGTRQILALEVARDGTLWIGSDNGLLSYRHGQFQKIENTENLSITAILLGEETFLATGSGLILKLTETAENAFKIEKMPEPPLADGSEQPLILTSLARVGEHLVTGTRGRSFMLVENQQPFEIFSRPRPFFINTLATDAGGKTWLGADAAENASGLYLLEDLARPQRVGEATGNILSIKPDGTGGVWAGTERDGLLHFTGSGTELARFTFENTAGGLRSNTVYTIFIDREGVIWTGTDRGVCRYDESSPLNTVLSAAGNGNFVRTLFHASDGQLYAGTNRGLFVFSGGRWMQIDNFSAKSIYAVGENSAKGILIGTAGGLFGLDGRQITAGDIRGIADFQGVTYAAVFGRGLIRIDTGAQISGSNSLTALNADGQNLWLGTADNGVLLYDGREITQPEVFAALRGAAIRRIVKDQSNNLWLAGDGGLSRLAGGRLENIIANQKVEDVYLNGADVWAATDGVGLMHFRSDEFFGSISAVIDAEQGLPSQKIFSILPLDKRLLLGTNRGLVNYAPNTTAPQIVATRVLSQRLYEPDELAQPIVLNYPQSSLLIEVAGLSSRTFPEQFQYSFLLKNSKGEILEKKLSNDAQYAAENLSAGEYAVEARAYNHDLIASAPLTIKFSVARAPYPWTAIALGGLLSIALIALIWAAIERRRIAERNRQLAIARFDLANEAERERKRLAGELHDQTLADLRNLMLLSDKLPADNSNFRAEVESISTEIRRICEDLSPSVLENVGLMAALEFLLKQTIENAKLVAAADLEDQLKFSSQEQMQLYRIVQEVLTNIRHHSSARFIEMTITASETGDFILSIEDDGEPFSPAQNLPKGRGISNIKSRAALIDAAVFWEKSANGGTLFQLIRKI